ncbi:HAD-IA family hydrolase [Pseudomonas putida]|uniref:HAD-IA family hydrolase n=1 Tax=Pseudomonas putida TaxID=303 RepID=UPI0018B03C53|nr:HAD-IA family hydrolase [Pseudomonas putida]
MSIESNTKIIRIDEHYKNLKSAKEFRHFYGHSDNHAPIAQAICDIAKKKNIKYISYDVFDTALLRECKSEARRFWETSQNFVAALQEKNKGKRGYAFTTEDVFLARIAAARAAYSISRTKNMNREGTFDNIAKITCDLLGCIELAPLYERTELSYELNSLLPNPLIKSVSQLLPDLNIVFISDMYLESPKIKKLVISKLGLPTNTIVYSSADGFGSKRSGKLFPHVASELKLDNAEILHVGDNFSSDYQMAKKNGFHAFYLPMPDAEKQARRDCYAMMHQSLAKKEIELNKLLSFNL